ncbi:hypothetical protein BD769DRAFT_1495062 [Suillus cothurnatus]|nr:hypothetical protein BD769DRAFT_1495062 [Suillus cothurnatus]
MKVEDVFDFLNLPLHLDPKASDDTVGIVEYLASEIVRSYTFADLDIKSPSKNHICETTTLGSRSSFGKRKLHKRLNTSDLRVWDVKSEVYMGKSLQDFSAWRMRPNLGFRGELWGGWVPIRPLCVKLETLEANAVHQTTDGKQATTMKSELERKIMSFN